METAAKISSRKWQGAEPDKMYFYQDSNIMKHVEGRGGHYTK